MKENKFIFLLFSFLIFSTDLIANPTGEELIHGKATFSREASSLIINQVTDKSIINWQDFSINSNETTKFIQPASDSSCLNRVVGLDISRIYGNLESNGKIYLINQKGILIGPNGVINSNGFIASTLDLENSEFLEARDFHFLTTRNSSIQNLGCINGLDEEVILIAPVIENLGSIKANKDKVSMLSSTNVLLRAVGSSSLVKTDISSIDNKGLIEAVEVDLKAANGNIYSLAINQEGIIKAQGIESKNGKIFLIADGAIELSGKLISKDSNASIVRILADAINIKDNTIIDASSDNGGSEILIGGDSRGKNPDIKNAQNVTVLENVSVKADAANGNGGKIIIFSLDTTNCFAKEISSQSFGIYGDGGFVEISGIKNLFVTTLPNLRSVNGAFGSLLLDPGPVIIQHLGGSSGPNIFSDDYISTQLGLGSLTIDTANGTLPGVEQVIIDPDVAISWGDSTTLEIIAGRNILTTSGGTTSIIATGSGNIILTANGNAAGNYHGVGLFSSIISTQNGNITITGKGGNSTVNYGISGGGIGGSLITTVNGNILMTGVGHETLTLGVSFLRGIGLGSATIEAIGSGNVELVGAGGRGSSGSNHGVALLFQGQVKTNSGKATINGSSDTGNFSHAVSMSSGSNIISSSGEISLEGNTTAPSSQGIRFDGTTNVITNNNILSVTCNSFNRTGTNLIRSTSGDIILTTDSFVVAPTATTLQTLPGGSLTIKPKTLTSIGIGTGTGAFVISNAFLQTLSTNVGEVIIGDFNAITTSTQIGGISTLSKDLTVYANTISTVGNININGNTLNLNFSPGVTGICTINNFTYTINLGTFNIIGNNLSNDTLNMATGGNNIWNITNNNEGYFTSTSFTGQMNFYGISNLISGNGDDSFIFNGAYKIDGTTGIDPGGGSNLITGPNVSNIWNITGVNSGSFNFSSTGSTSFTNIQSLIGGSGNDTFNISDGSTLSGTINGGIEGTNSLFYNYSIPVTATLISLTPSGASGTDGGITAGFSNITNIIGGSASDTLIGTNTNNTWRITSLNAGNVNEGSNILYFSSFENITAGLGNDIVILSNQAGLSGTLDGGLGFNILDYSAYTTPISVNLAKRTATNIGLVLNFQSFIPNKRNLETKYFSYLNNIFDLNFITLDFYDYTLDNHKRFYIRLDRILKNKIFSKPFIESILKFL